MRRFARVLVVVSIVGLAVGVARADTTIYQDSFSGSGDLNGWTPDVVDTGGATWYEADQSGYHTCMLTGTAAYFPLEDQPAIAVLPFTPVAGHVYTLSADGTNVGGSWVAIGFPTSTSLNPDWSASGIYHNWTQPAVGPTTCVLDTTAPGWTNSGGIQYVGFESIEGGSDISNFKLTMTTTPEPSSLLLLALGLVSLLAYAWQERK
jgi:hypothetical protein